MKSLAVNADYETELFYGHKGAAIINQSLEFLAFFLDTTPVYTSKKYAQVYLDYVETITGRRPEVSATGLSQNWWGELSDPELEKKLNSKVTSSEIILKEGWDKNIQIIHEISDFKKQKYLSPIIAKNPFGMSGQKFKLFTPLELETEGVAWLTKSLAHGPIILEPKLDRQHDFSHFVFPDGTSVCYENIIDNKFQYRGSLFRDFSNASVENLSFYSKIEESEWEKFKRELSVVLTFYSSFPGKFGYSIDSFTFFENGKLRIRSLCEVNFRRTMGRVAYDLSRAINPDLPWSLFLMGKSQAHRGGFNYLHKTLSALEGVTILSPGDTRFEIFLLKARDEFEGKALYKKLEELLPDGEFAVEF